MPAATEHIIVGKGFGKTHANTGADGSRHADQEGIPTVPRGKSRREDGSQRRDRSIHEHRKTGLNDLKNDPFASPYFPRLMVMVRGPNTERCAEVCAAAALSWNWR